MSYINPGAAELFVLISHSFKDGIAEISSFKWRFFLDISNNELLDKLTIYQKYLIEFTDISIDPTILRIEEKFNWPNR